MSSAAAAAAASINAAAASSAQPSPQSPSAPAAGPVVYSTMSKRTITVPTVSDALKAIPVFSAQLEQAVAEAVPDKAHDPLYAADFDPIAYLNKAFPDEQSLSGGKLDSFLLSVRRDIATLNETARVEVRAHSDSRSQTQTALVSASSSIAQLSSRISDIKAKALQSEAMVHGICRDITALDHAKRHIRATVTALRNLHMLVTALTHLKARTDRRDFAEAARLLAAVGDLFTLFEPYRSVPKVRDLRAQANGLRDQLRVLALGDLKSALLTTAPSASYDDVAPHLHNACLVLDALPAQHKRAFLTAFLRQQLEQYEQLFGPRSDAYTVEAIPRRYAWVRREAKAFDEKFGAVFPQSWHVPARLMQEFCVVTRTHISALLQSSPHGAYALMDVTATGAGAGPVAAAAANKPGPTVPGKALFGGAIRVPSLTSNSSSSSSSAPTGAGAGTGASAAAGGETGAGSAAGNADDDSGPLTASDIGLSSGLPPVSDADVALLTSSMLKTVEFERELTNKFKDCLPPSPTNSAANNASGPGGAGDSSSTSSGADSASSVKTPVLVTMATGTTVTPAAAAMAAEPTGASVAFTVTFERAISGCFVPYLGGLVFTERRQLNELLDRISRDEQWTGPLPPAASDADAVRPSQEQQDPEATGGERWLKPRHRFAGADELFLYYKKSMSHCAKLTTEAPFLALAKEYLRSLDQYAVLLESRTRRREGRALTRAERITACLAINTAEGIVEVLPSFLESITAKIAPALADKVTAAAQSERFEALASRAIASLVSSLLARVGVKLHSISRTNWGAFDAVGDCSLFISQTVAALHDELALPATLLSPKYHAFLCAQASAGVLTAYRGELFRARNVAAAAAQQLAVDLQSLRTGLLDAPGVFFDTNTCTIGMRTPASRASARMYSRSVSRELGHIETLIKVLGAPNEMLVPQFRLLFPNSGPADLRAVMELRPPFPAAGAAANAIRALEEEIATAGGLVEPGSGASAVFTAGQSGSTAQSAAGSSGVGGLASSANDLFAAALGGRNRGGGGGGGGDAGNNGGANGAAGGGGKDDSKRGALGRFMSRVMN